MDGVRNLDFLLRITSLPHYQYLHVLSILGHILMRMLMTELKYFECKQSGVLLIPPKHVKSADCQEYFRPLPLNHVCSAVKITVIDIHGP